MTRPYEEEPRVIGEALAYGVTGDQERGLSLLQPLVDAGPLSTYALLSALAEAAAFTALQNRRPGQTFTLPVVHEVTGQAASGDVLPPALRFAAQFVTTWANRDQAAARALFNVFAHDSDRHGTPDLAQAISLVYGMAVMTSIDVVKETRRKRGRR
jgi:hypothetical protein